MKGKLKVSLILITILSIATFSGNVNAAVLQSTPATHSNPSKDTWENWMKNIRNMENGAMGLSEEIDQTTLEGNNNGVDVHMTLNTEYGGMAILSLSNYGNVEANNSKTAKPESSTGNATGVYIQYNATPSNGYAGGEMTSGILKESVNTTYGKDYYNAYGDNTSNDYIGDAEDEFNSYSNRQTTKCHVTDRNFVIGVNGQAMGRTSGTWNGCYYTIRGRSSLLSYDSGSQQTFKVTLYCRIW